MFTPQQCQIRVLKPRATGGYVERAVDEFVRDMQLANRSAKTISDRVQILGRLARFVAPRDLLELDGDDLRDFQETFAHRAPSTVNIYSRNIRSFYAWAARRRLLPGGNPVEDLIVPRVPKGRPHPTSTDELRTILACTDGALRVAYVLAAFAGLRRGEICRLTRRDLDLGTTLATAHVTGKGGRERTVPLVRPVVDELYEYGVPRAGYLLLRRGRPYKPEQLSLESYRHLKELGVETTLHSMRHTFATNVARQTKDPLFVRDLLGHDSVRTTEIYMDTDMHDAHLRLASMSTDAAELLAIAHPPRRLRGLTVGE